LIIGAYRERGEGRGGRRGYFMYPLKRLQKFFIIKMQFNTKIGDSTHRFSHNPKYPLKRI
jgi:hypothetical protein